MARIFISYRRGDTDKDAGRLFDTLAGEFGEGSVFKDIETLDPGDRFAEVIKREIAEAEVFIALIGSGWLTAEKGGQRRLDQPDDFVRLEISQALAGGIRVMPVLVDGAELPARGDLPEELQELNDHNAVRIRDDRFREDVRRVVECVRRVLEQSPSESEGLAALIGRLKADDVAVRRRAALDLRAMRNLSRAAIPDLIEALSDPDPHVREYSAQALAACGSDAVRGLIVALRHQLALGLLEHQMVEREVPRLAEVASEAHVSKALVEIGELAVPVLTEVYRHGPEAARMSAAAALLKIEGG